MSPLPCLDGSIPFDSGCAGVAAVPPSTASCDEQSSFVY